MQQFIKEKYNIDFHSLCPKMQQIFKDLYEIGNENGQRFAFDDGLDEGYDIGYNEALAFLKS